jgi:hypothetical protein
VEPAFAARLELEVFDSVCHVDRRPLDGGIAQCAIEQPARGAHERSARDVLLIAGLLADENEPRVGRAFAEHGLRCVSPQLAAAAVASELRELGKARR